MANQSAVHKNRAVEIKGSRYSLMSLKLLSEDFDLIRRNISEVTRQAPVFFKNTPVIVDFSLLKVAIEFDFNTLFKIIRQRQLLPVAVCGIPAELREKMQSVGVPIVEQALSASDRLRNTTTSAVQQMHNDGNVRPASNAVVVDLSADASAGLYSEHGDLIVIGDTDSGSELIAAGNIHVYGALRGRALAGVHGDITARIFCNSLAAEHVSIAGIGLSLTGVSSEVFSAPVQISLKDKKLTAIPLYSPADC